VLKKFDTFLPTEIQLNSYGWPDEIPQEHLGLFHYVENNSLRSVFESGNLQEVLRGAINNNDMEYFIGAQQNVMGPLIEVAETILLKGEAGKETKRMFQVWMLEVRRWAQTYESCLSTLQANISTQKRDHELLQLEQKKVGDSMGYSE
jgi:hypothetical protein